MEIEHMQDYINQIKLRFGRTNSTLFVAQTSSRTYAFAAGFNALGTIGTIYVNKEIVTDEIFTPQEIKFILVHEYTHIFKNHFVANTLGSALEILAKGLNDEYYNIIEFLKMVIKSGELLLKIQECEADYGAVELTGDLNHAESCLTKLVHGDLAQPSHSWELYHSFIPAMTMGEIPYFAL